MCGFAHDWTPENINPEDLTVEELKIQIQIYETTIHNLNLQLTAKDIVIDKYIGKLHQIRAVAEKI